MITRKLSLAALTGGLTLAMLAHASPSFAIFPWYDARTGTWQRSGRAAAVVAPVAVAAPVVAPAACAPACNPCAAPACSPCATTCASPVISYVAETAYRVQVVNTPVTTYRPVLTPGPCGTCTTTLMPVTTLVAQTQQVPFTTYRPVVSCAPVCATCPTTCCPTDCATTGACPSGQCGGVAQASGTIEEAPPTLQAAPPVGPTMEPELKAAEPTPAAPTPAAPAPTAPTPAAPSGTYHNGEPMIPSSAPRSGAQPVPLQDLKQDGLRPVAPQLLDPNDKTAMRIDMPRPVRVRMVNDGGWHAPR